MYSSLIEIGVIILFAAIFANISRLLKQPLILGYVIAGILVGPAVYGFLTNNEFIMGLSELGIAFLLFIVGLELNLGKLKEVGMAASVTGILQVFLTALLGGAIAFIYLPFSEAIYVGFIIAFSSTMIVIKLLSDKGEIDTLHGKLILGILVVQDVIVIMLLPLLQNLGNFSWLFFGKQILKAALMIIVAYITNRFLISKIMQHSAKNLELLFVTSISICFLFSALAFYLGFSIAIGAFIAGVCLASLPYSFEIVGRVKSLRDFFIVIFFVTLGSQITFQNINFSLILIMLILVLILKPILIFFLLKFFKYTNSVSFISALSLGQVSEFSLVLAASALIAGQIGQELFNTVIIVSIISITLTPYFVNYGNKFYGLFAKHLEPFEKLSSKKGLERLPANMKNHIVILGAHRMGSKVIENLKNYTNNFVVIDFNPDKIRELIHEGINCIYGDISSPEVLEKAELENARVIISSVKELEQNLFVLKKAKEANKNIIIFVSSKKIEDCIELYRYGVDFVIFPEMIAGQKVFDYLINLNEHEIKHWGSVYYRDLLKEKRKNPLIV